MKTRNKAILTAVCAVLLVVMSVMGTMAYLTDKDAVANTFTVGNIDIILDEALVDADGQEIAGEGAKRVKGNAYHLLPGLTYDKDPMVTVVAGSEACYVRMFVEVENPDALTVPLANVDGYWQGELFLLQKLCGGWDQAKWACVEAVGGTKNVVEGETTKEVPTLTYEFRYVETEDHKVAKVDKDAEDVKLPALFTTIGLPGEYFGSDEMPDVADVKINVTAQAIQADGFETADEAWDNFPTVD